MERMKQQVISSTAPVLVIQQESDNAIPASEIQRMIVDTQGWAAGLVLAAGAWQRDGSSRPHVGFGVTNTAHEGRYGTLITTLSYLWKPRWS